jgi:PTS system nitrogen regulatory IIA component
VETLDIEQVASYLSRDVREVGKLASRGHLPGRKVNGEWRFIRAEVRHWLEARLHEYDDAALLAVESAHGAEVEEPLLANLLAESTTAVPLVASTGGSVLREMVKLAEQSWQVYDPAFVLEAIEKREEMASTARANGVAIPHAHRPLPDSVLGEPVVAFGRTVRAVPFGGGRSGLTDLFFLVLSKDDRAHLRVMARLARLMLRDDFVFALRAAETSIEARELILAAERDVQGG